MKTTYPNSAWACLDAIKAEELDAEERATLFETIANSLKNDPEALYLAAAVLLDHEYICLDD